jgi:hypothetical protein
MSTRSGKAAERRSAPARRRASGRMLPHLCRAANRINRIESPQLRQDESGLRPEVQDTQPVFRGLAFSPLASASSLRFAAIPSQKPWTFSSADSPLPREFGISFPLRSTPEGAESSKQLGLGQSLYDFAAAFHLRMHVIALKGAMLSPGFRQRRYRTPELAQWMRRHAGTNGSRRGSGLCPLHPSFFAVKPAFARTCRTSS